MIAKKAAFAVALSVGAMALFGCAAIMNISVEESDALPLTAKYFGAKEKEIKIKDWHKGPVDSEFHAIYKGTVYNCVIRFGGAQCVKPGAGF
jgi:hypothetical protein